MPFGKNLREMRVARKLTQQVMADEIGVALRTYQCYEQGVREPSYSLLVKIADCLDVTTDYLLGRERKEEDS